MKFIRVSLLLSLAIAAGCNRTAPTQPNFAAAINSYYQAHPACLWSSEKKFPVQAATSDDAKTQGYDALVDQGLLTRTTSEKKIIIISKQENNYDLSANGRSAWTADPNQPGYGNFCYGHLEAANVNGPTGNSQALDQPGATATVNYVLHLAGVPAWASAAETQTAFPSLQAQLSGSQSGTAQLTNTSNGWQVTSVNPTASNPATPADSKIVQ
jgi:hypothetical protein